MTSASKYCSYMYGLNKQISTNRNCNAIFYSCEKKKREAFALIE